MKTRLKRVAPLKAGIVLGILYAFFSLLVVPFILIMGLVRSTIPETEGFPVAVGAGMAIFLPILYGVAGFIGGVIAAFFYNIVAKWTGGFEITLDNLGE